MALSVRFLITDRGINTARHRPVSFSRKVEKLQIFIKNTGFHTFGMGITSHATLGKAPAIYIAAELREICEIWDLLLRYFKESLFVAVWYNLLV